MGLYPEKKVIFSTILCFFCLLFSLYSENSWEGNAAVIRQGEFETEGYFAASNSFPINTVIEVYNIRTGKSVRVTVLKRIGENTDIFILLSEVAANEIGIEENEVERVRVIIIEDYGDISMDEDTLYSLDPDYNPTTEFTMLGEEGTEETEEIEEGPEVITETEETGEIEETAELLPEPEIEEEESLVDRVAGRTPQKDLYKTPIFDKTPVLEEDENPVFEEGISLEEEETSITELKEPEVPQPTPTDEIQEEPGDQELAAQLEEPAVQETETIEETQELALNVTEPEEEEISVETKEPVPPEQVEVEETQELALNVTEPEEEEISVETKEPVPPEQVEVEESGPDISDMVEAPQDIEELDIEASEPGEITGEEEGLSLTEPEEESVLSAELIEPGMPETEEEVVEETVEETVEEETLTEVTLIPTDNKPPEDDTIYMEEEVATNLTIDKAAGRTYFVQLAAYIEKEPADNLKEKYSEKYPINVYQILTGDTYLYKVMIGPLNKDESGTLLYYFRALGYRDAFIKNTE
jgi:hypothetical protein